ncbi:MAG TPA: lysophospholipid acyltransferase family protein [Micropepsaceae bacterium]|nr:lysophospholipid acyltransferase family protein [Micropepsaceae bacterium]
MIELGFMQKVRGAIMLMGFLVVTGFTIPVQWIQNKLKLKSRQRAPWRYQRRLCRMMGFRLKIIGEMPKGGGVLVVANHISWLDIPIVGAITPTSFVAKAEVGTWPVFGPLARLQRTIFVKREDRHKAGEQAKEMRARLEAGDNLVVFPEGTSHDGNNVYNFKSSLLSVAEGAYKDAEGRERYVIVQPASVAYTHLNGMPIGRALKPHFAWYGDMELMSHLWTAFCLGPLDIEIVLHKPLTIADVGNRKELAKVCQQTIARGMALSLAGRTQPQAA